MWLYLHIGVRGTFWPDEWHRIINDCSGSLGAMFFLVLEWGIVFNMKCGPWNRNGALSQIRAQAEEYFRDYDWKDPMFRMIYPLLVLDWRLFGAEIGTEGHMKKIWEQLKHHEAFQLKGEKMKMGRWMSWFKSYRRFRKWRMPLLLILLVMGMKRGWWTTISQTPLFQHLESTDIGDASGAADDSHVDDEEEEPWAAPPDALAASGTLHI